MPDKPDDQPASGASGVHTRAGPQTLGSDLAALKGASRAELVAAWRRLFRALPPKQLGRDLLELGVAWKLQESALGGLSASAKRQLTELGRTLGERAELPPTRKLSLKPGVRLIREWGGKTHEVTVLETGFGWAGKTWPSLSAIARAMTGTRWSGPRFFGLNRPTQSKGDVRGRSSDA